MIRMQMVFLVTVSLLLFQCNSFFNGSRETDSVVHERALVWSDEFDYEGLPDSNRWSYNVGDACDLPMGCGWGNNELQYYTFQRPENARVQDGRLIIEARREDFGNRKFTSARLLTKDKGDWLYGRIEVRAKVPSGLGTWAAIWMLPSAGDYAKGVYGGWPHSGEIDIMEHVGFLPDSIFGTVHTLDHNGMHGTEKPGHFYLPSAKDNFHVYAIEWSAEKMDFFVDDEKFHTFVNKGKGYESWPFDQPFHLLLNIAVGGNWGGKRGVDESIWPQQMEIDYVRVYQSTKMN